jgi:hypothetical protein
MAALTGTFAASPIAAAQGGDLSTLLLGASKLIVFAILSCAVTQTPGVGAAKTQLSGASKASAVTRISADSSVDGSGAASGSGQTR